MSRNRYLRTCSVLMTPLLALVLTVMLSNRVLADESSCITCHTDEELLKENLGKDEKKKSALQAGSG